MYDYYPFRDLYEHEIAAKVLFDSIEGNEKWFHYYRFYCTLNYLPYFDTFGFAHKTEKWCIDFACYYLTNIEMGVQND